MSSGRSMRSLSSHITGQSHSKTTTTRQLTANQAEATKQRTQSRAATNTRTFPTPTRAPVAVCISPPVTHSKTHLSLEGVGPPVEVEATVAVLVHDEAVQPNVAPVCVCVCVCVLVCVWPRQQHAHTPLLREQRTWARLRGARRPRPPGRRSCRARSEIRSA
jgi:hypothetical protein